MKVQELAKRCADAITAGSTSITLVVPGQSRGDTRRLAGRAGPMGEVVSDCGTDERPEQLVAFDPMKVLAWLTAQGLVRVEAAPPGGFDQPNGKESTA